MAMKISLMTHYPGTDLSMPLQVVSRGPSPSVG